MTRLTPQRAWSLLGCVCLIPLCCAQSAAAQGGPYLVKDVATIGKSSAPGDLVNVAGKLFFVADDGLHGREVWESDGTSDGTRLVRDVRPGIDSSAPYALTPVGSMAYFVALAGSDGAELWRSDGSEGGTVRVAVLSAPDANYYAASRIRLAAAGDILVFRNGSQVWRTDGTPVGTFVLVDFGIITDTNDDVFDLFSVGDRVFFSAHRQLWVTDGTVGNTRLLSAALTLGFDADDLQSFAVVDDRVVFVANDDVHGAELWSSDGTAAGTSLFQDITPGPDSAGAMFLTPLDGALIFGTWYGARPGLWRTDGTAAGTEQLSAAVPVRPPVRLRDMLFFIALNDVGAYDIWRTDGTVGGTIQVWFSDLGKIVAFNDAVYFLAGLDGGCLLMRTLGTRDTTSVVWRINGTRESPSGTCVGDLTRVGDSLLFAAYDVHGVELWRSDGTAAGTQLVRDVRPSTIGSAPRNLIDAGGRLLFLADDDGFYGAELWTSDGSDTGTRLFVDRPASLASAIFDVLGDHVVFQQSTTMPRLWGTDGTAAGSVPLTTFEVFEPPSVVGNLAYFRGPGAADGQSLWRTDGTRAGTSRLRDVRLYGGSELGGRFVFFADDAAHGVELWRTDGTVDGTVLVRDINPGPPGSFTDPSVATWRDRVFFAADDGSHGAELWSSDGTAAGTVLVRDINPGKAGAAIGALTPTSAALFFIANDGDTGRELWVSDGTEAGTSAVADIDPGSQGSEPRWLTPVNGVVVFTAFDPDSGVELWRSDGTNAGTVLVKDIKPGPASSFPVALQAAGDRVYFAAHDGRHGWETWRTDGSRAGTELVADINAGGGSAFFTALDEYQGRIPVPRFVDVDGTALFVAEDGQHGHELWKSDSGAATLLADIAPGRLSSDPSELTLSGAHLFFTAENEASGRELWAVPRAEIGAPCVGDCESTWQVDVTHLVTGVRIVLGDLSLATCPALDANGDGVGTVDEVMRAVDNALEGCRTLAQVGPSPHPIESVTPLPSRTPRPTRTPGPTGNCRRTGCVGEICADHDVDFGTRPCFLKAEYSCLDASRCEMVADHCGFVIAPGDETSRCLASLGDCVFDQDCNVGEICEPALGQLFGDQEREAFGACALP